MSKYDDIIDYDYTGIKTRPRSSIEKRSSQFAAFQALTGYSDNIFEAGRETESLILLDDNVKEMLNNKFIYIYNNIDSNINVEITYFIKDLYKSGGRYEKISGIVNKINKYNNTIKINNKIIKIDDIVYISINSCDFN